MRTPVRVALALVLGIAAAAPAADLAAVVPDNAVFYAEISDPTGIWADFEQAGLRDIVRAVPQAELGLRLVGAFAQQQALQRFGVRWNEFMTTHAKRVGVVLREVGGPGEPQPVVLLDAADTRPQLEGLLENTVEATLKANQPGVVFADDLHQDVPLRVIKADGKTVAYAFVDQTLALGEPEAIKGLLDARPRKRLAADPAFAQVRKRLAVAKGLVAFLNLGKLLADNKPQIDGNPEMAKGLDLLGISAARWIAFSSAFDGRGVRDRVFLYTGERKIGLARVLGALAPGTSQAAAMLPAACPAVLSLSFKDGPQLWGSILSFLQEGGEVEGLARLDDGKQQILLQFGINFDEDLIGTLGGEMFIAASPEVLPLYFAQHRAPKQGDMPVILGFRVAKPEALKVTIHRVMTAQPIMGQGVRRDQEVYKGTEIHTLVAPNAPLQPAYAFIGDTLVVAKTVELVRQCVDAKAGGEGLATVPRYSVVARNVPAKHNALLYIDLQSIATAFLTQGRPAPEGQPMPIEAQVAGQLRGMCATLTAEADGVMLESFSRTGLLPLIGAAGAFGWQDTVQPPPPPPPPPKPKAADF